MSRYLFDNAATETVDRFTSLEQCYDEATMARLEALGVSEGDRCLEIGGGSGSIARWMAGRVGPRGAVIATDIDTERMRGTSDNLEIRRHDIVTDELPESFFDVVHARLVLAHLPGRKTALKRIMRALKPGGYLLLNEFDITWLPVFRAPDEASVRIFGKTLDSLHELLRRSGLDPAWGRNAHRALAKAGYTNLGVTGFCESWDGGSAGTQLHRASVLQVSDALLRESLMTKPELKAFFALIDDPALTIGSYLMLSTWGYRPAE